MITQLVQRFDAKRPALLTRFQLAHPNSYRAILQDLVEVITADDDYGECNLDPERIHQIDDGDYQGTLVFVIAAKGYQPSNYWATMVSYGSCSGCDTLQAISNYSEEPPTPEQANEYLTLALHMLQRMKEI